MTPELADKLRIKFPRVLSHPQEIWVRDGWYDLLNGLFAIIESSIEYDFPAEKRDQIYATQIKEKFGTLRVYMYGLNDRISGAIDMAELYSGLVCEVCGNKGSLVHIGNWVQTLCETDYQSGLLEYEQKQKENKT